LTIALYGYGQDNLPIYTTGKALGNILFGMNMGSISNMSLSAKRTVWENAMSAVGAYNENNNKAKIKDRFYDGENPYSGSFIYYGYWGRGRSSY
jgi:hypothetical protein